MSTVCTVTRQVKVMTEPENPILDQILDIMSKCQTGGYRIPKYLPPKEVLLQRKTGSLPGIRNDVGIVTIKETGEQYTLACFTMGAEDVYAAEEVVAKVSQAVYNHFSS